MIYGVLSNEELCYIYNHQQLLKFKYIIQGI